MAMMARMRSLAPWFIITVGGLFVLFMVLSDSKVVEIFGQRSNYVGSINDYNVTYQEFSSLVERARVNQTQQTGQEIDESQMDMFRDQVWDALVTQKLVEGKIDEFGIEVTDEEIKDVILGPDPPQFLKSSFIDSNGAFNRQLYEEAIFDPRNKEALLQAEDAVRQQKYQEKLQSLLNASVVVSESEIKQRYTDQNIKLSVQYAAMELNSIPDSAVVFGDAELEKYYRENLDNYKIDAQRKLKYVLFRKSPSTGDTIGVRKNLEAILANLEGDTASFKTYVEIYSDRPYTMDTLSITQIPAEARDLLLNTEEGEIVGPVLTFQGYLLYNLKNRFRSDENFVRASHILIKSDEDDEAARREANDIYEELRAGADFATLAKEKSADPGSAAKGGDLGWFGKGQMVPEFEKASFEGRLNVIQRPVKSNFGYHIIKVTGKTNEKIVVESIVNKIEASATTVDNLYNDAGDFAYLADKNGFDSEAELMSYDLRETPAFKEDVASIPGIGPNKGLVNFAFDNSLGSISDVYKVTAGYVVAMVSDIIKPGFKDFEEVNSQVKSAYLREKKLETAAQKMEQVYDQLDGMSTDLNSAKQIDPRIKINNADNFSPGGRIPNIGNEFAVSEWALNSEVDEISPPLKGNQGVYIVKLKSKTSFDSTAYTLQRNTLRDQLLQQKRNQFFSQWLQSLKEEADINDRRFMFYR
jgi:parvulin-like peptidyl-prolyl isomerase